MATNAERRAWLADNGHPELAGGKGRLPQALADAADAALAPADDYGPGTDASDFDAPLDPLDFVAADDPPEPPPPSSSAGSASTAPGSPAAEQRPARPGGRGIPKLNLFGRTTGQERQRAKRNKTRHKRVSIAPLIEDAYSDLAWAAAGIPPLRKLLQAQAPIAGVVLDPVVRDTIADPVLQIAARNHERMQVGMALLGTPASLMMVLATAPEPVLAQMVAEDGTPMIDGEGHPVTAVVPGDPSTQHQAAMLSLRYCVRAMATVSGGDALDRVAERATANAARDDQVNRFVAWLLDIPYAAVPEESDAAEARDAGLKLAGVAQ